MADNGSILVTGAAGQLGAVGRTVTGLLLDRGLAVRAMVRREDDRAAALRAAGAEVVVGDLFEPADVYRVVSGGRTGTRSERPDQHVPNDSLPDEHPEHHPKPAAAAALAQRAGARVVRPA